MAEAISLCKAEGQQWGFRLTGGADFGTPLAVIKVTKDSVAERAGLHAGDMIMTLNDVPLGEMTHAQSTDYIIKAGNNFKITVIRGSFISAPLLVKSENQCTAQAPVTSDPECLVAAPDQEDIELPVLLAHIISDGLHEQQALIDEPISVDLQQPPTGEAATPVEADPTSLQAQPDQAAPSEAVQSEAAPPGEAAKPSEAAKPGEAVQSEAAPPGEAATPCEAAKPSEAVQSEAAPPGEAAKPGEAEPSEAKPKEHIEYTEEEIAEMMSGCAEVLMGSCIGVDFQKLPPDTDIMKSEVLHLLIEEKIDKPKKTLSTFNQRPKNPKPKPKGEPEVPRAPYLPLKYVAQKKKPEPEPPTESAATEESVAAVVEEGVPQELGEAGGDGKSGEEDREQEVMEVQESQGEDGEPREQVEVPEEPAAIEETVTDVVDATDIESQLAEIQNQLAAIIQLPVEIQQHLSFIQQQLAKILELRAAEQAEGNHEAEEEALLNEEGMEDIQEMEVEEGGDRLEEGEEGANVEEIQEVVEEEAEPEPEPEPEPEVVQPKKDIEWKKPEPEKRRPFFPLTPQPRPVQLPGGRKWFAPKDVYTEDFIAETLSGNEQVIRGTTIGVDFHKFDRNYDHLKSSSVYKMVHDSEDGKKRVPGAFPGRTDKARAKEDYIAPEGKENDVMVAAEENEQ